VDNNDNDENVINMITYNVRIGNEIITRNLLTRRKLHINAHIGAWLHCLCRRFIGRLGHVD
jgi:hypothetical protein